MGRGEPLPLPGTQGTGSGPFRGTQISAGIPHLQKGKKKDLLVTSGIPGEMGSRTGSLHFPHGAPLSPTDPKMASLSPTNMGPETKLKTPNSTIIVNLGP